MIVVEIIQYFLAAGMGILLGYQMLLSFLAIMGGRITNFKADNNRKFAIVIPAGDEDKIIAKSLYSISGLVYPKNMYDLIVIADNCSDETFKIARNLGATVLERSNSMESKNSILRWAFEQILDWEKNYDAIVVFDSDSLVSGNYLEVMNYYLEQGSKVVQSSGLVPPKSKGWAEIEWIGFLLDNYVKPMGRKVLGLGVGLLGSGMCFTTDVLREIPWRTPSLSDDFGYELTLQLKGAKVDFSPEAYVWTQKPVKAKDAELKRTGWSFGSYPLIKKYAFKMLAAAFKKQPVKYFDRFIELITPSFVNSLLLVGLLCGINGLLVLEGWISVTFLWIWLGMAGIVLLYLLLGVVAATKNSGYRLPDKTSSKQEKIKDEII